VLKPPSPAATALVTIGQTIAAQARSASPPPREPRASSGACRGYLPVSEMLMLVLRSGARPHQHGRVAQAVRALVVVEWRSETS